MIDPDTRSPQHHRQWVELFPDPGGKTLLKISPSRCHRRHDPGPDGCPRHPERHHHLRKGSILGGNQLVVDANVLINVCGNAIAILGFRQRAAVPAPPSSTNTRTPSLR